MQTSFNKTEQKHDSGFSHPSENVSIAWELGSIDPIGQVVAVCGECGHEWKLRHFKLVDELIELHGYQKTIP
ncbi:hypothetical protein DYL72_15930 [Vibrio anguillarum]|uniref:Uncharacterized protein n=1 Tax=Vibrio anguillarum TaxID=55601 RepID=A0A7U6J6D5_VIBAN|nr:hypothetical protein [Vibrio anguillarum]AZS26239.1 hypothetical protein DYL72_15130 [Vibrio anguillarum]AZS26392.1 hypothetical protein DYL72_15930 [Vibrio anguillarum]